MARPLHAASLLVLAVGQQHLTARSTRRPSYDELLQLVARQRTQLAQQQQQLAEKQHQVLPPPPSHQHADEDVKSHYHKDPDVATLSAGDRTLPPGSYNTTCRACAHFGDSLWCDCPRKLSYNSSVKWEQTAVSLSACRDGANATVTVTAEGFLSCAWRDAPPPRVGNLTAGPTKSRCRYIPHTSFVSPEFRHPCDPIATIRLNSSWPWHDQGSDEERGVESEKEARACCKLCTEHSQCKGWSITSVGTEVSKPPPPCTFPPCPKPRGPHGHRVCQLVSQTATATASLTSYSGYPIEEDAASWCESNQANLNRGVPASVRCGSIAPKPARGLGPNNASGFPRRWIAGIAARVQRGTAWLFYPCKDESCLKASSCSCKHTNEGSSSMRCEGPEFDQGMQTKHIKGKPWAVFVHGGEFTWGSNIDQGYAILAAQVAQAGIGVLAVDYRTAKGHNLPWDGIGGAPWPAAVNDIIQACEWLTLVGASNVSIFGDSSGGTIVYETLLMMAQRRPTARPAATTISSVITFSAWLDLTCANPGYRTNAYCAASNCLDAHSPDTGMHTAGWDAAQAQCAALSYAGGLPLTHPLLSPFHAGPELLGDGEWPPTLAIVGGSEILMPETLQFATNAQAAGAPVMARVYAGMFHDFQEFSQGCGGKLPLTAGAAAFEAATRFLLHPPSFSKLPGCADGSHDGGCDYAPIAWVSNFTKRPPIAVEQCAL